MAHSSHAAPVFNLLSGMPTSLTHHSCYPCPHRRVVSVGGHDRGIYQWRTLGINLEDAEQDNKVMACRSALLIKHRQGWGGRERWCAVMLQTLRLYQDKMGKSACSLARQEGHGVQERAAHQAQVWVVREGGGCFGG